MTEKDSIYRNSVERFFMQGTHYNVGIWTDGRTNVTSPLLLSLTLR